MLFLSGCATELPVLKRDDIQIPSEKATLAIEIMTDDYGINPSDMDSVRQTRNKYFTEAEAQKADFVLKETSWRKDCFFGGWSYLTVGTAGFIPTWGRQGCFYSYSLTRRKTGKTVFLSDIRGETRLYLGWLMMPAIFFPNVKMDLKNTLSRVPAMIYAIGEAAFLVYDTNSKLYETVREDSGSAFEKLSPSEEKDSL